MPRTRLMARKQQVTEELGNWEEWRNHGEEIRQHVLKISIIIYIN